MIPRYSRKEMAQIWEPMNKFKIWLDIEIYAAQAMEKYKIIPKGVAAKVRKKSKINIKRIDDIEKKNKARCDSFSYIYCRNRRPRS